MTTDKSTNDSIQCEVDKEADMERRLSLLGSDLILSKTIIHGRLQKLISKAGQDMGHLNSYKSLMVDCDLASQHPLPTAQLLRATVSDFLSEQQSKMDQNRLSPHDKICFDNYHRLWVILNTSNKELDENTTRSTKNTLLEAECVFLCVHSDSITTDQV